MSDTSERPESYWEQRECCANCLYAMEMAQKYNYRCLYGISHTQFPTSLRQVQPHGTCDYFREWNSTKY